MRSYVSNVQTCHIRVLSDFENPFNEITIVTPAFQSVLCLSMMSLLLIIKCHIPGDGLKENIERVYVEVICII